MIKINKPYDKFLASRKSTVIPIYSNLSFNNDGTVRFSALSKPKKVIIPPLNSNINFTSVNPEDLPKFTSIQSTSPPEFFSIANFENITPVQNQYNCGCCWAFACAASINDNLIYQKILDKNPNISPSYLMSCDIQNNKCQGGNPSSALSWIEKNGIATNQFENFSWCSSNSLCSSTNFTGSLSQLNELVPECKKLPTSLKFFIKNVKRPIQLETDEEIISNINLMKRKLMDNGSLLGGISVYENLLAGNFLHPEKNPDAIYLDKVDYQTTQYNDGGFPLVGFHAITVLGWGSGKVHSSLLGRKDDTMVKVPYWLVRNSWSEDWGIDGYFHLAMYPYNKLCQLEKALKLSSNNNDDYLGGFLFFDVDGFSYKENYEEPTCEEPAEERYIFFLNIIIVSIFSLLFLLSLLFITYDVFFVKKNKFLKK